MDSSSDSFRPPDHPDVPREPSADGGGASAPPGGETEASEPGSVEAPPPLPPSRPDRRLRTVVVRKLHPVRAVYALTAVYIAVYLLPHLWRLAGWGEHLDLWLLLTFAHDRLQVWEGEYWRLATSTFLHEGWFHLVCNLAGLVLFGRTLERLLGAGRFLLGYGLSLAAGALTFQAMSGTAPGLGASGGICGILGIFIAGHCGRFGQRNPVARPNFWLWMVAALGLLILEAPLVRSWFRASGRPVDVALSVHIGGFVCGAIFGFLSFAPARTPPHQRWIARLGLAGLFILVGGYGLFYPVFDWAWQLRTIREVRRSGDREQLRELLEDARAAGGDEAAQWILQADIDQGRLPEALEYWREHPLQDPELHQLVGYIYLYDALAADDRLEEGNRVLDELIQLADESLAEERTPDRLNNAAWYRALRETDLATAELYAREALEKLRKDPVAGTSRESAEANILNTLGWVLFLRGEFAEGWSLLLEAARREQIGPHLAYLALAAFHRDDREAAAHYAARALRAGQLMRHEKRLMQRIQEALATG